MSEVKMFSEPVPNVPWQERPANDNHDRVKDRKSVV